MADKPEDLRSVLEPVLFPVVQGIHGSEFPGQGEMIAKVLDVYGTLLTRTGRTFSQSPPSVIHKIDPEYTEQARAAGIQGTVVLMAVIDETGHPRNIKVTRSLGLGLDQKAVEAVKQWAFKRGQKDGVPVPVTCTLEINFRLPRQVE